MTDWKKLLTQTLNPSLVLKHMQICRFLPKCLADLEGVQQSPEWHPEGDALTHTFLVCDAMSDILSREAIVGEERYKLMLAAMLHDVGKATTTRWNEEKQKWTAYGHDQAGIPIAHDFLCSVSYDGPTDEILALVKMHMAHTRASFTEKSVRKLLGQLKPSNLADLLLLMEADCRGRGSASSGLPSVVHSELVPIAVFLADGVSTE